MANVTFFFNRKRAIVEFFQIMKNILPSAVFSSITNSLNNILNYFRPYKHALDIFIARRPTQTNGK